MRQLGSFFLCVYSYSFEDFEYVRFKFLNGSIRVSQSRSANSIVICWFVLKIRGLLSRYPFLLAHLARSCSCPPLLPFGRGFGRGFWGLGEDLEEDFLDLERI